MRAAGLGRVVNISGTGPVQPFVTASPYSPLGKPAVGQESPDTKDKPLPPVEETEAPIRSAQHRIGEEAEGSTGQGRQRQPGKESAEAAAEAGPDGEATASLTLPELEVNALAAQLAMRACIDQAGHPVTPAPASPPRLPPGGFESREPAPTGALLDQKI